MKMNLKMMIWACCLLLLAVACNDCSPPEQKSQPQFVDYVNPLMGTDSKYSLSNGNTYPAIANPWGMNFWTPMTNKMGDGWTYQYDADKIRGIKQTHQPSPWINDYAAFSLMPVTGSMKFEEEDRASWFSHKAEEVHPYLYQVYLADHDVTAAVTPTERAAVFEFTFPENDSSFIVLDAFYGGSMVKVIPEQNKIIGYCRNNHGGVPDNFHNYFVLEFDKSFEINKVWEPGLTKDELQLEGEHVGAVVGFKTKKGEKIHVKVASSFISPEQAQLNLDREVGEKSFQKIMAESKAKWEKELSRIAVLDGDLDDIRTFYSCLYRVMLFPRMFYEYNAQNEIVHYSPYNGKVLPGYMYTDNGFWDTFRAVFPFFNLMYPSRNEEIMESLANAYSESGWLPEWASPGHRDCMIGSNSASLIADAITKGVVKDEAVKATLLEAVLKNATVEEGRPVGSVGRAGLNYYLDKGYVPYNVGIKENTARTLEYAYADFCIAQMAKTMGREDLIPKYMDLAMNYQHVFDPETKWMRGKNLDGQFQSPFNPLKWGDAFTEGNSLHYTWSVFQDIAGLAELMGGNEAMEQKLDEVFSMPPDFDNSYYGFTIHEIREMQIANMGNYAHGNQPIQHMIYLYNHAGAPYKAQKHVRDVLSKMYSFAPDGYCGDEDNGQTSAWFVFSAMGFYPVTPAVDEYVVGSPLFKKMRVTLENGKTITIDAEGNDAQSPYINEMYWNGTATSATYLKYDALMQGGNLRFEMSDQPNVERGAQPEDAPFSLSLK